MNKKPLIKECVSLDTEILRRKKKSRNLRRCLKVVRNDEEIEGEGFPFMLRSISAPPDSFQHQLQFTFYIRNPETGVRLIKRRYLSNEQVSQTSIHPRIIPGHSLPNEPCMMDGMNIDFPQSPVSNICQKLESCRPDLGMPRLTYEDKLAVATQIKKLMRQKSIMQVEKIAPEEYYGNIEYKRKIEPQKATKLESLVTQLNFRVREGQGQCEYRIGVEDDGMCVGLSDRDLKSSLYNLYRMTKLSGDLEMKISDIKQGTNGKFACVKIRSMFSASDKDVGEKRICVAGPANSGKTTLIGVLVSGCLDDGKGDARMKVTTHPHEIFDGRTSSVNEHILGFTEEGDISNHTSLGIALGLSDWDELIENSKKLITLQDSPGHQRFFSQVVRSLVKLPDYAMLVTSATDTKIEHMVIEEFELCLWLSFKIFFCVTKMDLVNQNGTPNIIEAIIELIESKRYKPRIIKSRSDYEEFEVDPEERKIPVFLCSCVPNPTFNLEPLKMFLNCISSVPPSVNNMALRNMPLEVVIDWVREKEGVGTIVGGTVRRGVVEMHDKVIVGPFFNQKSLVDGSKVSPKRRPWLWPKRPRQLPRHQPNKAARVSEHSLAKTIGRNDSASDMRTVTGVQDQQHEDFTTRVFVVSSIHQHKVPVGNASAKQHCSFLLEPPIENPKLFRRGMVMVQDKIYGYWAFEAELLLFHKLKLRYVPTVHIGSISTPARVLRVEMNQQKKQRAVVLFAFLRCPEHFHVNDRIVVRDKPTKGCKKRIKAVGIIVRTILNCPPKS